MYDSRGKIRQQLRKGGTIRKKEEQKAKKNFFFRRKDRLRSRGGILVPVSREGGKPMQ